MPVANRIGVMNAADRMVLRIRHFARGTYPEADGTPGALPVNRFFLPIRNPNGKACFMEDAVLHEVVVRDAGNETTFFLVYLFERKLVFGH